MTYPIYIVDAFAEKNFQGNPAAVCPLETWLDKSIMQAIAMQNNLSETAFLVKEQDGFGLKWFTPQMEIDLCGHATVAAAHVISNYLGYSDSIINFYTNSGKLTAEITSGGIVLDFPSIPLIPSQKNLPVFDALGAAPIEILEGNNSLLCIFDSEKKIQEMKPDFSKIKNLPFKIVYVSAKGENYDFVSRVFGPSVGIDEDPVTGSAYCSLIPYWAQKLNKQDLTAMQISQRSGILNCRLQGERVKIGGRAITYLKGEIYI